MERVQSWVQVEAAGSPGQHVEVALEAQVVSGLGAGWTLHLLQTLKERNYIILGIGIKFFVLIIFFFTHRTRSRKSFQSVFSCLTEKIKQTNCYLERLGWALEAV